MLPAQIPNLAFLRGGHITGDRLPSLIRIQVGEGGAAVPIEGYGLVVKVVTCRRLPVSHMLLPRPYRRLAPSPILYGPPLIGRFISDTLNMTPLPFKPDIATTLPVTELVSIMAA